MAELTQLSPMLGRLRESATIATTAKARALKRAGRDVLVTSGGEPDFDTPDHIKDAAIKAIRDGFTKYTPTEGIAELRQAIVEKFARDNGMTVKPEEVIVGAGAKQVVFDALIATLTAGDEAVIPRPSWVSYADIVELAGAAPVFIDCRKSDGFKLRPEELRRAITPRTRWFIINSPNNPSGAVYSQAELRGIADVLLDHPHVLIMSDDIYEHILFDGARFTTLAQVEPRLMPRTLTINGVSKTYCMTGWRIGYGAGPQWLIRAMTKLQSQTTTSLSSISQAAAVAALRGPHDFVAKHNRVYQERRDLVIRRLNQVEGLSCTVPAGAFYVYIDVSGLIGRRDASGRVLGNDLDVADHMLTTGGVAVVPGSGFGMSPYVRLCFAYATETMAEACNRMARAVAALS